MEEFSKSPLRGLPPLCMGVFRYPLGSNMNIRVGSRLLES